ncbi:MAG: hypothetical protein RIB93_16920 [Coleofasciculus sp. D1-CHI-01]
MASWNALCWNGSLNGYANDVMFACENAVSMPGSDKIPNPGYLPPL